MSDTKQGDSTDTDRRVGTYPVVVVIEMEGESPTVAHITRDRYIASSIGAALDAFAPDPGPGARFVVEYAGRALDVRSAATVDTSKSLRPVARDKIPANRGGKPA